MELAGKVVVVTGGASGIGAGMARRFADEGTKGVVVADLNLDGAEAIAKECGGLALRADVSLEQDNLRLIEATEKHFGPIDLFCANAGIAFQGSEQDPDDAWDRMWRVNFMAHVYAARHLVPRWRKRGAGYLLVTASAAGLLTNLGAAQYSVTKHAAVALAEWLSITYATSGIKVSCLCPQGVDTPMIAQSGPLADFLRSGVLSPGQVAEQVVEGLREERFLILPHPEVAAYLRNKTLENERWLEGMRHLARSLGLGG